MSGVPMEPMSACGAPTIPDVTAHVLPGRSPCAAYTVSPPTNTRSATTSVITTAAISAPFADARASRGAANVHASTAPATRSFRTSGHDQIVVPLANEHARRVGRAVVAIAE